MSEDEETGSRESPMIYDGGLIFGPPSGHVQGVIWRGHPPLDCPWPRYATDLRGRYKCPGCGMKTRLAGHRTAREFGYEVADRWWETVAYALAQVRDLFRRRQNEDIGSPVDRHGQADREAVSAYSSRPDTDSRALPGPDQGAEMGPDLL